MMKILANDLIKCVQWPYDELGGWMMNKLIIKVIGALVLILFLIYLFYSPRLKFDVLENPNNNSKQTTSN